MQCGNWPGAVGLGLLLLGGAGAVRAAPPAAEVRYRVVQCAFPVSSQVRRTLEADGLEVLRFQPPHGYLVRCTAAQEARWRRRPGVTAVTAPRPADKIARGLRRQLRAPLRAGPGLAARRLLPDRPQSPPLVPLAVQLYPGEVVEPLIQSLRDRYGGHWQRTGSRRERPRLLGLVPRSTLAPAVDALAAWPGVEFVGPARAPRPTNDDSVWIGQSYDDLNRAVPVWDRGVLGQGQVVALADSGLDPDACQLVDLAEGPPGPVVNLNHRKVIFYDDWFGNGGWDESNHGTHVAGSIAGDDQTDAGAYIPGHPRHDTGDGMAPAARLVMQDVGNGGDFSGLPQDLLPLFQQAYDAGARIHSNSWTTGFPAYNFEAQDVDEFMWTHPDFLILIAMANSGPCLGDWGIGNPATAKDCVSVGATEGGSRDPDNMTCWSSTGPPEDGRLKPTVVAPGYIIRSAGNDGSPFTFNCFTRLNSGTSMATPTVAGYAALVRQYFTDGYYPAGTATPAAARTPSAALLKALLVNASRNMTGAYTAGDGSAAAGPIPTPAQGWGRVLLDDGLYFAGETRRLWVEEAAPGLETGARRRHALSVIDGTEPLEVTLVWTDYPSSPTALPNLVNDLDLRVTAPDGTVFRGNVYSGGQSVSGGAADRLNVVEAVQRDAPAPGTYLIEVEGFQVPFGPQPFALVATGGLGFSAATLVLDRTAYPCAAPVGLRLFDEDLAGAGTTTVEVSSGTEPTPEVLSLTEAPAGSGLFTGSIATTAAPAKGDGLLSVADGGTITATAVDADDGQGNLNVSVQATAGADCQGPVIRNVRVAERTPDAVTIAWETDQPADSGVGWGLTPPPTTWERRSPLVTEHQITVTGLAPCTLYFFSVRSADPAGNVTVAENGGAFFPVETYAEPAFFQEDFEGGEAGWTATGLWHRITEPTCTPAAASPTASFYFGRDAGCTYGTGAAASGTLTSPALGPVPAGARLQFRHRRRTEGFCRFVDLSEVRVAVDGGPFQFLASLCDQTDAWEAGPALELGQFAGATVQVRFQFDSLDAFANDFLGWMVDDVTVSAPWPCHQGEIGLDAAVYGCDDQPIALTVRDPDLNLDSLLVETVVVLVTSETEPAPEAVALTETAADSALFTGSIRTAKGAPVADGRLQISDGDTIQAAYADADIGNGDPGTAVATARGHCAPILQLGAVQVEDPPAGGNGNGQVEPGETVRLPVTVTNVGSDTAHRVKATLSTSTPDLSLLKDRVTYGQVDPGQTRASQPSSFLVQVGPSHRDTDLLQFTLTLTGEEGSWTVPLTVEVVAPAGAVPAGSLTVSKNGDGSLALAWAADCSPHGGDYALYRGPLAALAVDGGIDPARLECLVPSTGGATAVPSLVEGAGSSYLLPVPNTGRSEGSYGRDGAGVERPPAACAPLLQRRDACP